MNSERWRRIEALFDRRWERPDGDRGGFLDEACAARVGLR